MVKSGETYTKTMDQDVNDLSEWPRNIFVPSKEGCGLLTYIQQYIFRDFKAEFDGKPLLMSFCHGLDSSGLKQRVKDLLGKDPD